MTGDMNVNQQGISQTEFHHLLDHLELSEEKELIDLMNDSTISKSLKEAVMMYYAIGIPFLERPEIGENGEFSWSVSNESVQSAVEAGFAKIGSDIWDRYAEYLEDQKKRIAEYLDSPQYREKVERQSPAYLAYIERNTPIDTQSQARNATGYQEWLSTLPPAARDIEINWTDEKIGHSKDLWNNLIDATSHFLSDYKDEMSDAVPFMAASFVISSTFIGDYMNIVDVASTEMVTVNPVQDAAKNVLALVEPAFHEQVTLAINFFAVGLVAYSNAEAIGNQQQGGQEAASKDAVLAFANSVIDKVKSNEINYFLMALLVNSAEKGQLSPQDVQHLTRVVKAAMLSVALAALYKFEAGEISEKEFRDLLAGKMEPRTEEERQLVLLLNSVYTEGMAANDGQYEGQWRSVMDSLVSFILSKPSVEDLINPTRVWAQVGTFLRNPNPRG